VPALAHDGDVFELEMREPDFGRISEYGTTAVDGKLLLHPISMPEEITQVLDVDNRDVQCTIDVSGARYDNVLDAWCESADVGGDYHHHGLIFAPSTLRLVGVTTRDMLVAVALRLLTTPDHRVKPSTPEAAAQYAALVEGATWLGNSMRPHLGRLPSEQECAALMGGARGRHLLEMYELVHGGSSKMRVTFSLKRGEWLPVKSILVASILRYYVKPRGICPINEVGHASLIGGGRQAMTALCAVLDGRLHTIVGVSGLVSFSITVVCGYSGAQLSALAEQVTSHPGWGFLVSGDDGLMVSHPVVCSPAVIVPTDASRFEASIAAPQSRAGLLSLALAGMDDRFLEVLTEALFAGFKVKHRSRMYVVISLLGAMEKSGLGTTTLFNCIVHVLFILRFVMITPLRRVQASQLEGMYVRSAADCGFTLTSESCTDIGQCVFLRGWWRKAADGQRIWLPVPGMIGKLGKVGRDPVTITKVKFQPKLSYADALATVARSIAACYNVDRQYPILGAMMQAYDYVGRDGTVLAARRVLERADHKPLITVAIPVDRQECLDAMVERYGVSRDDLLLLDAQLRAVRHLPVVVRNPVVYELTRIDY